MGVLVKQLKNGKYKLWSTITDSYLTGVCTRDEAIDVLIDRLKSKFDADVDDIKKTFPYGWFDKDDRSMITKTQEVK